MSPFRALQALPSRLTTPTPRALPQAEVGPEQGKQTTGQSSGVGRGLRGEAGTKGAEEHNAGRSKHPQRLAGEGMRATKG